MNILNVVGRPTVADLGMEEIAKTLIDGANDWATGNKPLKVKLYSNDPVIAPAMVLGDFTESAFSGYAAVTLDDLAAAFDPLGVPILEAATVASFVGADPLTVPGSATGYYIVNNAGTVVVAAERFDDGFAIDEIADTINLTARLVMPGYTPA